jgi:lysozyme
MKRDKLIESIKKHEGLQLKVYTCPAGYLTIGYGRNLETNGITQLEAEDLLYNDLLKIYNILNINLELISIDFDKLPLHVQNVLLEMSYQMGVEGVLKFKKTLEYIRKKDFKRASDEMLLSTWYKQTPNRALNLSKIMKGGY